MRIEQRQKDPQSGESYEPVLTFIAVALNINLNITTHNGRQYYSLNCVSIGSLKILLAYLDQHPLYSSKRLNCLDFKTCVEMIQRKEHVTTVGRDRAKVLRDGMNNTRTLYSWDHLNGLRF